MNKDIMEAYKEYKQGYEEYKRAYEDLLNRLFKIKEYVDHERFKRKILLGFSEKKYMTNIFENILDIIEKGDINK